MAGIDFRVLGGLDAQPIYDPNAARQRDMQAQEGQLRLATLMQQYQQGQREAQRDAELRTSLSGAFDPTTGAVDAGKVRGAYVRLGDLAGLTAFNKSQAEEAKAGRDAKAAELDYQVKAYDAIDRSLAGVGALPPEQRAQAWAAERQRLSGFLDPETFGELPGEVDDATIQRFRTAAMSGKDRAAAEQQQWERRFKVAEFGYRQQNDATNRAVTLRGQDMSRSNALISANSSRQPKPATISDQINLAKWQQEQRDTANAKAGAAQSFDTAIGTLTRLTSHPGMSTAVGAKGLTGGLMAGWVPSGTDAAGFLSELEAFKSQMFLPMVQQLKGMGALSNAEGQKLTAAVGALDPSMPEAEFQASAARIMQDLEAAKARVGGVNFSAPQAPAGIARPTQPRSGNPSPRQNAQTRLKAKYGLE